MAGLAALYWPIAIGNGLQASQGVEFLGAATLDVGETAIHEMLGMSAADYAAKFGVKLYSQAEEMVAQERLDTVVLITRHTQHAEWAERLAKLGVNLFIPKTFATSLADAERIVDVQKRYGVEVAVGPSARFLPPMMAAKAAVAGGLIGKPFAVRICHHHGTIDVFNPHDWYRDPDEGGPELSLGWYGIDLILHFMEDRPKSVCAEYGNFTSPGSPFMDCGRLTLRMETGGIASFDMYFCNRVPYPAWQMEIVGPEGVISIHRTEGDSNKTIVSLDGRRGYQLLPMPESTPGWETFWIEDFKQGRPPAVSAETAQLITRISLAARDAAHQGRAITL
jgi:predicted dehydrogenase